MKLSVGQVEGFFLDTCILLPMPLVAVMETCSRFMKEASGKCFLSSSVKKEGLELIEKSHDTIVLNFHEKLKPYLEKVGINEISNRDGELLANFYAEQKAEFRKLPPKRTNLPNEILNSIEGYVATQLHSIEDGEKIPADYFLAAISMQLAIVKHELESPFRGTNVREIQPLDSFYSAVSVGSLSEGPVEGRLLKNQADITHLASALEYQFRNNKWVIFVTTDQDEILSRAVQFGEMFLRCSKPEWAVDYYQKMTREKAPLQHLKEIQNSTNRQKAVIDAVKSMIEPVVRVAASEDNALKK